MGREPDPKFDTVVDARPGDLPWPSMGWPPEADVRLRGRFVELSRFDPTRDAGELFDALDHDAVWRHLAGRPDSPAALVRSIAQGAGHGRLAWVARLLLPLAGAREGAVAGTSSYLDVSVLDARLEIGWTAYAPRVWGTAVNPDAKLQLLAYAFDVLGAGRVQLKTDVRNLRSQQAIVRLGATYEGTLRRYQRRNDGSVRDTVMFSVVAEEWPSVRKHLVWRLDQASAI